MLNQSMFVLAALCFALHAAPVLAGAAATAPRVADGFVQDRFVIGYWVTPPVDARLDEHFREIADAGFTLVLAGYKEADTDKELEMLRKHDLRALVWRASDAAMNAPRIWGKIIKDEPNISLFKELKQKTGAFKEAHPNKLAYINLYPNYASPKQMGVATYDEYVKQFVQDVKPEVLSMDHYPRFIPGSDGRDGYCENLATMRKYSLQAGIPFWNFFNVMPFGAHTDPTEGQLRWQVYSSIAYGAKGILYFCYYTPSGKVFARGGAIIDRNGRKTRHYKQAAEINAQLKNLGPTLMRLTSTSVHRVKGADSGDTLDGTLLAKIHNAYSSDVPLDLQIGAFKHEDGRQAVLIHNYRFAYTAWMTVSFAKPVDQIAEIDRATGREIPIYDESPAMPGTQISLDAGDGRLFIAASAPSATRK